MHETEDDIQELQRVLDESYAKAGDHLRSIFTRERRMSAADLAGVLRGVFVLQLATVTARSEPLLAPVDGLFYRGRLWFSLPPGSVRARLLRVRPQVSATYAQGEDLCVIAHGVAHEIDPSDASCLGFVRYCREVYGPAWDYWIERYRKREGVGFTASIEPRRLYAAAMRPEVLQG